MFVLRKTRDRFTLLLLDEGEHYFEDYSARYYPPPASSDPCLNAHHHDPEPISQ